MKLVTTVEISEKDLLDLMGNQIDIDIEKVDNRDRVIDSILQHGLKSDYVDDFLEIIIGQINMSIGIKSLREAIDDYEEEYLK